MVGANYLHLMDVLTEQEGTLAVHLARDAIGAAVSGGKPPSPTLPPVFVEKRGVFVTITRSGELRGCIGFPYPVLPLQEAITGAARSAALEDPRFSPVTARELDGIRIEVTVLTIPVTLDVPPDKRSQGIVVGKHGLIAKGFGRSGLLLPQVATEQGWDASAFLTHTCIKAGLPGSAWTRKEVEILTFEGQIFHEKDR
jgi:uncharacterized protein